MGCCTSPGAVSMMKLGVALRDGADTEPAASQQAVQEQPR
jgi:hypothetical protein